MPCSAKAKMCWSQSTAVNMLHTSVCYPESLSISHRLDVMRQSRGARPPVYFAYGTADTAVQPFDRTLAALRALDGEVVEERREGVDHGYDENANEECLEFRDWLGRTLL